MDLSQLFGQLQSLMQPYDGALNWNVALDLARKGAASSADPTPGQRERDAVADALRLADHWLDSTTDFTSGVTSTAAWSRAEWVEGTLDVWKVLVEPVAEQSVQGLSGALPAEAQAMAGPMIGMIGKAMGAMLATQVGSGLGALAGEVLTVSDIGLPLAAPGKAALVMSNVRAFAEGLDVGEDDVVLYLALREAAHQRLFGSVPWLREHLIGAVAAYAGGVEINAEGLQQRMEEQLRGVDPTNPESLQALVDGGLFDLPKSPKQEAALSRLEVTLALVEGWVDEVVGQATAERMPAAAKMQEAVRRRRAAGGPAEQTFAALVGLELRPRRLRDASTLWGSLRTRQGTEARDGVWMHPDLLPTQADLDDPLGFREESTAPADLGEVDFDAELRKLLDGGGGRRVVRRRARVRVSPRRAPRRAPRRTEPAASRAPAGRSAGSRGARRAGGARARRPAARLSCWCACAAGTTRSSPPCASSTGTPTSLSSNPHGCTNDRSSSTSPALPHCAEAPTSSPRLRHGPSSAARSWSLKLAATNSAVSSCRSRSARPRSAARRPEGSAMPSYQPSAPVGGAIPATQTTAVTRSGSRAAQASACGPPPETPSVAKRPTPAASATAATSAAACATVRPGSASVPPYAARP